MWPIRRFRVQDRSMEPQFHEGDYLLINCWAYLIANPKFNDVVVLQDPLDTKRVLLKRIKGRKGEKYIVVGDNTTASRILSVTKQQIIGKLLVHIQQ